jgi:two-component system, OmpR family, sensor histidine kinase QseC
VIADLVPQALEKDTDIELIAPNIEPIISGYNTAISILMRNLVDNAIRYTPEHSFIQVIIEHDEARGTVLLRVIDNGPGIPEDLRQQVFERFFRVIGNKSPGSGLGLGIVQQIVELHQATIGLETPSSGHGLEVVVVFAAAKKD